jgi:hypothetical protein
MLGSNGTDPTLLFVNGEGSGLFVGVDGVVVMVVEAVCVSVWFCRNETREVVGHRRHEYTWADVRKLVRFGIITIIFGNAQFSLRKISSAKRISSPLNFLSLSSIERRFTD